MCLMPTYPIPATKGPSPRGESKGHVHLSASLQGLPGKRAVYDRAVFSLRSGLTPHGHFILLTLKIYKLWMRFVDIEYCFTLQRTAAMNKLCAIFNTVLLSSMMI